MSIPAPAPAPAPVQLTRAIPTGVTFTQTVAATTWTIVHNLGRYPIVDVFVLDAGSIVRIMPSAITYVDGNTCTLSFSSPRAGTATIL